MNRTGRPFEPGNHFGHGRPRGSRNKRTQLAQQMLDDNAGHLMRKVLLQALQGDPATLRMLVGYILPRHRDTPVNIGPLPMGTIDELAQASATVLQKTASGEITPGDAQTISGLIEAHRKVLEAQQLDHRLRAMEERFQGQPGNDGGQLGPEELAPIYSA